MKNCKAVTDVGKKRPNNQDFCFAGGKWFIVADGMGGHNGGETASRTAVEVINAALMQQSVSVELLLRNAVATANTAVYNMASEDPALEGMGTTVVLCYFDGDDAVIAHAGDSRAYLMSAPGMRQITCDHSIVQQLIESGTITTGEARTHPQKNLITRAVGTESAIEVDISRISVSEGDKILLCTDGLTLHVSDDDIAKIIKENNVDDGAVKLVEEANKAGGTDNITVILIEV